MKNGLIEQEDLNFLLYDWLNIEDFLIKNNYNKFLLLSGIDQSDLEKNIVNNFSIPTSLDLCKTFGKSLNRGS